MAVLMKSCLFYSYVTHEIFILNDVHGNKEFKKAETHDNAGFPQKNNGYSCFDSTI